MKRKFTILTAALALLAFLALPMGMMGQTRESYNVTYSYDDLGDMLYGSYLDASSYWKVPETSGNNAVISIPITYQPESDITVTFRIATFGSGNNPSSSNTTITAAGTESNSNWSGFGVSTYPSSSTYVNGVMTITKPQNPTTLGGLDITMGVNTGVKIFRLQSVIVSYTYGGGTPTPTTYTVTYDCNGGTSGCPQNLTGLEAGDEITLADGPVKDGFDFAGWSDGNNTYDEGYEYTVNGNVTFTAQWNEIVSGDEHWVLTELADLTSSDVFVIVGNGYAMTNNNGTSSAPATSAVTITGNEITSTVAANIKWTVSGNTTNGYTFYPNGSTTTWLYCNTTASSSSNNNMRVGTGNRKAFVLNTNNYLLTKDDYTTRYLSIYDNSDWRGYVNTNLSPAISFYKKTTGSLPPSITANNVSIAYDATSGEIEYTLNNPAANGSLSVSDNVDWISNAAVNTTESKVTFTTTANEATTAREGIITITYTYNRETISKDVTVTQAAAPVIYTTIPALFAAATGTETSVLVTFNNWVVSGVSSNGKNVFVTDNNGNGFVIYYTTDMSSTFAAGNILSGTAVSCTLKKYNGFAELLNVTATDLTITSGGTVTVADVALADLAGVNTGALLHYDNLTCSVNTNGSTPKYYLSDGTTNLQVYTTLYAFDTLVEGKTYNITGIYQQYNNTKEILPRSADDIEEVAEPSVTVTPNAINAPAEGAVGSLTLTYENITDFISFDYYFCDSIGEALEEDLDWIYAEINEENDVYSLDYLIDANESAARTAYIKVYTFDDELEEVYAIVIVNQAAAPQQYTLTVEPFENLELITFVNEEMVMEGDGEIQVNEGDQIMLSIVADPDYVMETLMVNNVNHVNDIADDFTYTFDMPAENVTISASAVENVAPAGGNYVRITSLEQLTDGCKVIIAARYDEDHANGYYAMPGETSGKPVGVAFTSETSGNDEILPATITASEDTYYWTVNVTEDGYTFTNAENYLIGYTSGTNFATGGNNTEWTITRETAIETTMVAEYTGFVIRNSNTDTRAFAFNGQAFGAYATSNMTSSQAAGYNFFLDFFVQTEEPATETYTLDITGYGNSTGGYYLIAMPATVDLTNNAMTTGDFDLYYFDEAQDDEWRNYETQPFNLEPGKGYLYAHKTGGVFTLTGVPYSGDGEVTLSKKGGDWEGWNLVGNPFNEIAYIEDCRDFYTMQSGGSEILQSNSNSIEPKEGIFVIAEGDGERMTFTNTQPDTHDKGLALNLTRNNSVIDRAVVRFGEGRQLPKFQLNPNHTKVYIPMDGKDYAVVRSEEVGEMPVSFKAENSGRYTLSFSTENVEFGYLHLIDNMTGADVDLLANPSYSFSASTTDYAQRFRLVFATGNTDEEFAFFSNGSFVINNEGNATLQIVDVTGRIIKSESINGCANVNVNAAPGVYMLRLVNGNNVKVQKVVVK